MRFLNSPPKIVGLVYLVLLVSCGMQPNLVSSSKRPFQKEPVLHNIQDTPKNVISNSVPVPLTAAQLLLRKQYFDALQDVRDIKNSMGMLVENNAKLMESNQIVLGRAIAIRAQNDSLKNVIYNGSAEQLMILNKIYSEYESEKRARIEDRKHDDIDRQEGRAFRVFFNDFSNYIIGGFVLLLIVPGMLFLVFIYKQNTTNKLQNAS